VSSQSPWANCEDFNEDRLLSYKNLFSFEHENLDKVNLSCNLPDQQIAVYTDVTNNLKQLKDTYIGGIILKILNRDIFKNCETSIQQLCIDQTTNDHGLIEAREYQSLRPSLKYPATLFKRLVQNIISFISHIFPLICHHPQLRHVLLTKILSNFNLDTLHCSKHEKNYNQRIAVYLIKLIVNHSCTEVNRILTGNAK